MYTHRHRYCRSRCRRSRRRRRRLRHRQWAKTKNINFILNTLFVGVVSFVSLQYLLC